MKCQSGENIPIRHSNAKRELSEESKYSPSFVGFGTNPFAFFYYCEIRIVNRNNP
ncbi:hypothetical protein ACWIUD_04580 [Helicobacter sp. 23-1044]